MRIRCYFEPRDLWVGVFWTVTKRDFSPITTKVRCREYDVFICLLPCLPIWFSWIKAYIEATDGEWVPIKRGRK